MYSQVSEVIRDYKVLESQQQQILRALHVMDQCTRWAEELPKYLWAEDALSPCTFLFTEEKRKNVAFINLINSYYQLKKEMIKLGELKIQNNMEGI